MKQKLQNLLFLFLLGTMGVKAQGPVITADSVNPRIGDRYKIQGTSINSITAPDSGGANKIWDYSNLKDSGYSIYVSALSPKGLPLADSFSSANIAFQFAFNYIPTYYDTIYHYDTISNNIWAEFGRVESLSPLGVFSYNPYSPSLHYPIAYKDIFIDSSVNFMNFAPFSVTNYDTIYADGYGTLKLPNATYHNVIRVYKTDISNFVISYLFYVNGVHFPLLELDASTSTDTKGVTNVTNWNAAYYAGTPLPLQISSFTAAWQNKTPHLQWSAANTENTKQFNIQRSIDAKNFVTVGQVGINGGSAYHFEDNTAPSSTVFYRLQQVDKNGQTFYSSTARLTVNGQPLTVYPNPAKGSIHIADLSGNRAELMIYDVAGKLVYQNKTFTATNTISTDNWSKGRYTIRLKDNEGWKVSSFEKE